MDFLAKGWFSQLGASSEDYSYGAYSLFYRRCRKLPNLGDHNAWLLTTKKYNTVVSLNGFFQFSGVDVHYAYKEMITHIPLCSIIEPKKVLVIGGDDGAVITEVTRHSSVQTIDWYDRCEVTCNLAKRFPLHKDRLQLISDDLRVHKTNVIGSSNMSGQKYDAIILDCPYYRLDTDKSYLNQPSLEAISSVLEAGGVFCMPVGSTYFRPDIITNLKKTCNMVFKGSVACASVNLPTYPSGGIGFLVCSNTSVNFQSQQYPVVENAQHAPLKYYSREMHATAFWVPHELR